MIVSCRGNKRFLQVWPVSTKWQEWNNTYYMHWNVPSNKVKHWFFFDKRFVPLILPAVATLQHSFGIIFDYSRRAESRSDPRNGQLLDKRHYRRRHRSRNRFFLLTYTIISIIHRHDYRDTSRNDPLKWTSSLVTASRVKSSERMKIAVNQTPHSKSPSSLQSHYNNIFLKITGESKSCWIATSKTSGSLCWAIVTARPFHAEQRRRTHVFSLIASPSQAKPSSCPPCQSMLYIMI